MDLRKKILIVDDDADFTESLSAFLEAKGFHTLKARDGGEGLKIARLQRPDLIIMDVVMNERTEGFFTVQQLRRVPELQATPIFVLSSIYSTHPEFQISPDSGWLAHDEFLSKPPDMNDLLGRIRRHLAPKEATA
ncbi:MAG: response regulator [Bryobacteraceae bacterium]|nr:response regulator [Bryobacteraceae bacterium]